MTGEQLLIKTIKQCNAFEARVIELESDEYVNKIRISAIRDLARLECVVSGPVITNEESRKQMIDWANFEESCNN